MAEATQKEAEKRPLPGSPEARESGRRNLNSQIAQRQKMLLAGIGAIALIGGGMFIFGGDGDEGGSDANGAATIDTGGLVNRNLSQREFVASYGNRLDAQGRAIKDLQQAQLPRPEIEQELEALRSENAQMRSDGQAAIDAISAENANLRSQLSDAAKAPATAPPLPPPPAYGPGVGTGGAVQPPQGAPETQGGQLSLMSFSAETRSSRATKKLLLIDEAWAMLKGGSMGEFVETYGRAHFMTQRFDRTPDDKKLHMQSLCAMRHFDFNLARAYSYEQAIETIRMLGLGREAIKEQVRRALLNVFIRNQDDHTKNIAFLMDSSGRWSLSPAFDVVYAYNPDGDWTNEHQMSLAGKTDGFEIDDLLEFGKFADLKTGEVKTMIAEIRSAISFWDKFTELAGLSKNLAARAKAGFRAL